MARVAHVRNALVAVAGAIALLAGCSVAQSREVDEGAIAMEEASASEANAASATDVASSVEVGPDAVEQGEWFDTWEEAAVAEAERRHPGLVGLTAERVHLTTEGERVVVRGEDGFCALYGGLAVEEQWQANELMVLDDYCGAGT